MRTPSHFGVATRVALLIAASASVAAAQLPNASPAATGLSGAFTTRARGYDAVAWNPANLGLAGNPGFSLGVLAVHGASGLDPISLSDFAPYSGKPLPASQREAWVQTVVAKGGQNGHIDGGVTALALSAGPFAFQVAGSVAGSTKLNGDAFEAIFFGNAGRTGSATDLNFQGSNLRFGAFTTAAASYGASFGGEKSDSRWGLGVTAKYVIGNAVGIGQDIGSTTTNDAVTVNFPVIYSRPDSNLAVGSGAGLDLGLAWSNRRVTFGATVQNVVNSFAWDETKLMSKSATLLFDGSTSDSDFDDKPYSSAPAELRAKIAEDKFKPIVAAGIAFDVSSSLTISADARQQLGDALLLGPKTQVSGGVEFRGIPALRLRGGASYVTNGWGMSGGAGLAIGPYELGVGAALRTVNGGQEPVITINVLSFR
jgi:hypothetical protein